VGVPRASSRVVRHALPALPPAPPLPTIWFVSSDRARSSEHPREPDPAAAVAARLPVTDAPTWLMLLALAVVSAAGLLWAIVGSTPDGISGQAIVLPATGFIEVGSELQGTVTEIGVAPGDVVAEQSVVAKIRTDAGADIVVTSPVQGRVVTVLVRAGVVTDRGTALLTVEPGNAEPVVVGFVPAGPGKRIEAGMTAHVSLDAVPRSAWGMVIGTVTSVSPVPVSSERVLLLVGGNRSLADFYLAKGPVLEVTAELTRDATTPSGYKWTAGAGPDIRITPGSLAVLTVVLSDDAPLRHLLP